MKQRERIRYKYLTVFTCLVLLLANVCFAQTTVVKGIVKDATTMKPLSFASVYFEGGKGVMTGEDGSYSIETQRKNLTTLIFSYTGYRKV